MTLVDVSTPIRRGTIASRYLEAISCGGNDVSALSMTSPQTKASITNTEKPRQIVNKQAKLNDSSCGLTAPTAPLDGSASWTTIGTRTTVGTRSRSEITPRRPGSRHGSFRRNRSAGNPSNAAPKAPLGVEDDCSSIESSSSHRRKPAHLSIDLGSENFSMDCSMNNSSFMSNVSKEQSRRRGPAAPRWKSRSTNDASWIASGGVFPKTSPKAGAKTPTRPGRTQVLSTPYSMRKTGQLPGSPKDKAGLSNAYRKEAKPTREEEPALSEAGAATEIITNRTVDLLTRHASSTLEGPPTVTRRDWPPPPNKSLMDNTSFETASQRTADTPHRRSLFDVASSSMSAPNSPTSSRLRPEDSFGFSTDQDSVSLNTGSSSIRVETGAGSRRHENPIDGRRAVAAFGAGKASNKGKDTTPKRDGARVAAMFGGRKVGGISAQAGRFNPTARGLSKNPAPEPPAEPKPAEPPVASTPLPLPTAAPAPRPPPLSRPNDQNASSSRSVTPAPPAPSQQARPNKQQSEHHEESSTTDDDIYVAQKRNDNGEVTNNFVVYNDRRKSNMDEVFQKRANSDTSSGWTPVSLSEKERMSDYSRGKSPIQPLFSLDRVEFSFDSQASPSRKVRSRSLTRMLGKKEEQARQAQATRHYQPARSKSVSEPFRRKKEMFDKKPVDPIFCPQSASLPSDESRSMSHPLPSDEVRSEAAVFAPEPMPQHSTNNGSVSGVYSASQRDDDDEELVQIMDRSNELKARSSRTPGPSANEILDDLTRNGSHNPNKPVSQAYRFAMAGDSRSQRSKGYEGDMGSVKDRIRAFNGRSDRSIKSQNSGRPITQAYRFSMGTSGDARSYRTEGNSVKEKLQKFNNRPPDKLDRPTDSSLGSRRATDGSTDASSKRRIYALSAHLDRLSKEEEKKSDDQSVDMSTIATHEDDNDDGSVKSLRERFEGNFSPKNGIVENIDAVESGDDDDRSVKGLREKFEKNTRNPANKPADGEEEDDEGSVKMLRERFEAPPKKPTNNQVSKLRAQFESGKSQTRLSTQSGGSFRQARSRFEPRKPEETIDPAKRNLDGWKVENVENLEDNAFDRPLATPKPLQQTSSKLGSSSMRPFEVSTSARSSSRLNDQQRPATALAKPETKQVQTNTPSEVMTQIRDLIESENKPVQSSGPSDAMSQIRDLIDKNLAAATQNKRNLARSASPSVANLRNQAIPDSEKNGPPLNAANRPNSVSANVTRFEKKAPATGSGGPVASQTRPHRAGDEQHGANKKQQGASPGPVASPFLSMRDRLTMLSKGRNATEFTMREEKPMPSKMHARLNQWVGRHKPAKMHPLASQEKSGGRIDDEDAEIGRVASYDLSSVVSDDEADANPEYSKQVERSLHVLGSRNSSLPQTTRKPVGEFFSRTNRTVRAQQQKEVVKAKSTNLETPQREEKPNSQPQDPETEDRQPDSGKDAPRTEYKNEIFRVEAAVTDIGASQQKVAEEEEEAAAAGRNHAVAMAARSNLKTKSTETEHSDGVTLDISVADVSLLTNPSAIHSKPSQETKHIDNQSSHSSSVMELMAKKSEASSSQLSEAAAPLIGGAMRLVPLSDEMSRDTKQRAAVDSEDQWVAAPAHNQKNALQTTPRVPPQHELDEVPEVEWDIQQVQSSFPFQASSSENLFDVDPSPYADPFPACEWPEFDQDDNVWPDGSRTGASGKAAHSTQAGSIAQFRTSSDFPRGKPNQPNHFEQPASAKVTPVNSSALNRQSMEPKVQQRQRTPTRQYVPQPNQEPVTVGDQGFAGANRLAANPHAHQSRHQQGVPARVPSGARNTTNHTSPQLTHRTGPTGGSVMARANQPSAPIRTHRIFPTTTPRVGAVSGTVPIQRHQSASVPQETPANGKHPHFPFDADYETIMESRHEMLMSRQRTHVQRRSAREIAKQPEKRGIVDQTNSITGSMAGNHLPESPHARSGTRSAQHPTHGSFFGKTHPSRVEPVTDRVAAFSEGGRPTTPSYPRGAKQTTAVVPQGDRSNANSEPVFDLSGSYTRYRAAKQNPPTANDPVSTTSQQYIPQQTMNKSPVVQDAQKPQQTQGKSASFYDRMASRLGFAGGGGSRQEALITRLRAVQAARLRRSNRREAASAQFHGHAARNQTQTLHQDVTKGDSYYQPRRHMDRGPPSTKSVSEDIAAMLEVD